MKSAHLAFFSACQTSADDESLSEEAVHIAAGMMAAGYRSVIGTMWSISDTAAPVVASRVYEVLFRDGGPPDSSRAAYALHDAIRRLQSKPRWSRRPDVWAPFVHYGV